MPAKTFSASVAIPLSRLATSGRHSPNGTGVVPAMSASLSGLDAGLYLHKFHERLRVGDPDLVIHLVEHKVARAVAKPVAQQLWRMIDDRHLLASIWNIQ